MNAKAVCTIVLLAGALMAAILPAAASAARTDRGTYCQTIKVKTLRHKTRETWKVYRVGGNCRQAKQVMAAYWASVYRFAKQGACDSNTCANAPAPPGYRCGSGTAGQELNTGYLSSCRRPGVTYRLYSDRNYVG